MALRRPRPTTRAAEYWYLQWLPYDFEARFRPDVVGVAQAPPPSRRAPESLLALQGVPQGFTKDGGREEREGNRKDEGGRRDVQCWFSKQVPNHKRVGEQLNRRQGEERREEEW